MKKHFTKRTWILVILLILGSAWFISSRLAGKQPERPVQKPQLVRATAARLGSMELFIQALGTVSSPNTVTVKSRVDGQLMALHFTEGQLVHAGDLLAEIDPRPFEVQLQQAQGALARDEALLKDAELDLIRYRKLIKEQSVSQQQLQTQESIVGQHRGAVITDKAAVANAELQLSYSRISAPVPGRVGLKKVDVGNMIRSADSEGIVVITQIRPMHVIFTLVEKQIPAVFAAMREGGPLTVEVRGQDNKTLLGTGELLTIDNQIDTATGTVKAKAVFANKERSLFPNQFVNARLKVKTLEQALIIPTSAVQRNTEGFFVYRVEEGRTHSRAISPGYASDSETVVEAGLAEGDIVVTDGVDRLRDGMPVIIDTKP